MMVSDKTCRECVHYELCKLLDYDLLPPENCTCFKDSQKMVELPCKVGDLFCILTRSYSKGKYGKYFVSERQISAFEFDGEFAVYDYDGIDFSLSQMFFDKAEAEARAKELNEDLDANVEQDS